MSVLNRPINYEGLQEELQEALHADTVYQLQNDAKIRAMEQNVPTYEHFRQIVIQHFFLTILKNNIIK